MKKYSGLFVLTVVGLHGMQPVQDKIDRDALFQEIKELEQGRRLVEDEQIHYRINKIVDLIESGHDLNTLAPGDEAPILLSSLPIPLMRLVLSRGANPDIPVELSGGGGTRVLFFGVKYGDKELTELLLQAGAHPNSPITKYGDLPLHYAVNRSHASIVTLLLAHKADPNALDERKSTALMSMFPFDNVSAAICGNETNVPEISAEQKEIVSLLLDHGADPFIKCFEVNKTVFEVTEESEDPEWKHLGSYICGEVMKRVEARQQKSLGVLQVQKKDHNSYVSFLPRELCVLIAEYVAYNTVDMIQQEHALRTST